MPPVSVARDGWDALECEMSQWAVLLLVTSTHVLCIPGSSTPYYYLGIAGAS